jgi:cold shock CspA family protein
MTGTIKALVLDRGYGFIRTADGFEYFFLRTEVVNVPFDNLFEGQRVKSFVEEDSMRGPRAARVVVDTSGGGRTLARREGDGDDQPISSSSRGGRQ